MKMLLSDDDFVRTLIHAYDPVKRKEYYERTKKLKGRRRGRQDTSSSNQNAVFQDQKKNKRSQTEIRIAAYKLRLEKLKKVLAQLVAEAKKRNQENSGSKDPEKATKEQSKEQSKERSKDKSKDKPLTGQEKAEARKRSKENYEKNKDKQSLSEQEEKLKDELKEVREKIQKVRAELKGSVNKARNKTNKPQRSRAVESN